MRYRVSLPFGSLVCATPYLLEKSALPSPFFVAKFFFWLPRWRSCSNRRLCIVWINEAGQVNNDEIRMAHRRSLTKARVARYRERKRKEREARAAYERSLEAAAWRRVTP